MPSASNSTNSTFDPYTQPVTIYMANGVTPVTFLLSDLDAFNYYNGACGINYGCQMGACFVMCFVIIVLTKESKRRSAMFILNLLSLLFGFFRALLLVLFFVGPWSQTYPQFTGDLTYIPRSAFASSIAGVVMPLFMTITVDMSLVLQAYTVCKSMRTIYRHIITVVSCIVLLVTVGFRFAQMVTNAMTIVRFEQYFGNAWIQTGTLATETGSIWFFSIIFTGKLVWTLVTRKIMGWKQWSGVRILAAMGGCTMIVPSVFAGLEYMNSYAFPEAGSLALTMVALLLPISSLWAGMAIDQEASTLNLSNLSASDASRRIFGSTHDTHDSHGPLSNQLGRLATQSSRPEFSTNTKGSMAQLSPAFIESGIGYIHSSTRDSTELDLEAIGVRVIKSYHIQHDS